MNTLKGFMANAVYADNTAGTVSPLGELSTYALTFSREKGYFVNDLYPGVELVSFSSKDDTGASLAVPQALADVTLQLGEWVYGRYQASTIPSNTNKAAFLADIAAAFPAFTNILINELVELASPVQNIPDYVEWQYTYSGTDYTIRIWFMDGRFRTQYDEYEILVIPPMDDIDLFNNATSTVSPILAELTPSALVLKIAAVTGTQPSTMVKTQDYVWVDPTFPASTRQTTWTLVIYGAAGNDADHIKTAIRDYIEAVGDALINWPVLFPTLYSENEFVIMPLWDRIAAPETGFDYGIYSPTYQIGVAKTTAELLLPDSYAMSVTIGTFLDNNLEVSGATWRSVAFLAVGNPNNAGAVFRFAQKFADYMNVPTSSTDFARMSASTAAFALKLNEALEHARNMTASSPVPLGFNRTIRNGKVYLTFDHEGTIYLIVTKSTYLTAV